jgi:hypothetical protein
LVEFRERQTGNRTARKLEKRIADLAMQADEDRKNAEELKEQVLMKNQ